MLELAAQAEQERKAPAADILAGLGRPANAIDRVAAENLAALNIRANKLEAAGKDATEVRRQINQALRTTGFRPQKIEPAKQQPYNFKAAIEAAAAARRAADAAASADAPAESNARTAGHGAEPGGPF
jgi:hypothetical protein